MARQNLEKIVIAFYLLQVRRCHPGNYKLLKYPPTTYVRKNIRSYLVMRNTRSRRLKNVN